MDLGNRTLALEDLQRLTGAQAGLLHRLIELGLLTTTQVEGLINQLVRDRFGKARRYLKFAQRLDAEDEVHQVHIISRGYYAMYHAARAVVFHHRRVDVDDHERLAVALGQILGGDWEDAMNQWRRRRNRLDYSPYVPPDIASQCLVCIETAEELVRVCEEYLVERGVGV